MPGDIGEAKVAALVTIGEPFVIDAAEVKHRRVQIVHVNLLVVLDELVAQFIGASPRSPRL